MTVDELTREQKIELKQALIDEREGSVSFGELCDADALVTDDELKARWGGAVFSPDDFTCGKEIPVEENPFN